MLGRQRCLFRHVCISVVDASGKKVFDELIKTDDESADVRHFPPTLASRRAHFRVVDLPPRDLKTRFSGIHPEEYSTHAVLVPLESVRRALNGLISANTILIGHVLDNDLRVPPRASAGRRYGRALLSPAGPTTRPSVA